MASWQKRKIRRLRLRTSGGWYLALTIGLGVAALVSANNVLYLIESLLLSGLILSGILSERFVSAVQVDIVRRPLFANTASRDVVRVTNLKRFPLFCLEVGEWIDGRLVPIAFIPRLGAHQTAHFPSRQRLPRRGRHRWDGIAIATSYPFGFAQKIKVVARPGERLVWPEPVTARALRSKGSGAEVARRGEHEFLDGEVRQYTLDDDLRHVIWTLSDRGGPLMVRIRRAPDRMIETQLDLRKVAEPEVFERRVSAAASVFFAENGHCTLTLIGRSGKTRIMGRQKILDRLAIVEPEVSAA